MHSLSIYSVCGLFGYTITLPTPPPPLPLLFSQKHSHQTVFDLVLNVMTSQDILNAENNAQNPLTAKAY